MHPSKVDHQAALRDAYRAMLAGLLSEPMTLAEFAGWLDIGRNRAPEVLRGIDGVEHVTKQLFRVPIHALPPRYFVQVGCLVPAAIEPDDRGDEAPSPAEISAAAALVRSRWTERQRGERATADAPIGPEVHRFALHPDAERDAA